jgi:hypothetical protein
MVTDTRMRADAFRFRQGNRSPAQRQLSHRHVSRALCRVRVAETAVDAYFLAAWLPAAMITNNAKAISAHQAMLSVSFCHFRTSHMSSSLPQIALVRTRRRSLQLGLASP